MNDEHEDFFKQRVNFAIVINGDLEAIDRLKHFIADEGFKVIYQRKSLGKLIIKEGEQPLQK